MRYILHNELNEHVMCFLVMQGIARKLVEAALQEAAKKREVRYTDLRKIERGVRRHFHDDITVVVLFLNPNQLKIGGTPRKTNMSMKPNF